MRVTTVLGMTLTCAILGACAQQAQNVDEFAVVRVPDSVANGSNFPRKTPGNPRLSSEALQPAKIIPKRPPAATFLSYDGRGPNDAVIPDSVRTSGAPVAKQTAPASRNVSAKLAQARIVPPRVLPAKPAASDTPPSSRSLRSTPAPLPRPISSTPRPMLRPLVEVANVQSVPAANLQAVAPRPFITPLSSLSLPVASRDTTPGDLPLPRATETAIPLGTIPASLGLANLKAAEAAIPVADALEQSVADDAGAIGWTDATALLRAGEVESAFDIGEFEVLMTLCSGRGIITIQPTPGALEAIEVPKVVCGKSAALTSQ